MFQFTVMKNESIAVLKYLPSDRLAKVCLHEKEIKNGANLSGKNKRNNFNDSTAA